MSRSDEIGSLLKELREGAEGILKLADSIEEKLDVPAKEPKKAKETKKPEPKVTLPEIKEVLMEKARTGLNEEVHALIKSYGAEKLSMIDSSLYGELMEKAKALGNG